MVDNKISSSKKLTPVSDITPPSRERGNKSARSAPSPQSQACVTSWSNRPFSVNAHHDLSPSRQTARFQSNSAKTFKPKKVQRMYLFANARKKLQKLAPPTQLCHILQDLDPKTKGSKAPKNLSNITIHTSYPSAAPLEKKRLYLRTNYHYNKCRFLRWG